MNATTDNLKLRRIGVYALMVCIGLFGCTSIIVFTIGLDEKWNLKRWIGLNALFWSLFFLSLILFDVGRRKWYGGAYKKMVVKEAAKGVVDSATYFGKKGLQKKYVIGTGQIMVGDTYRSEDLVEGMYHGISFRRADVYTAFCGKRWVRVLFQGAWYILSFKKQFPDVQIISRDFRNEVPKGNDLLTAQEYMVHKFETGWERFDANYRCICRDVEQTKRFLTPQLAEAMLAIKDELFCPVMLGVSDNRMNLILWTSRNHMEPPFFGKIDPKEEIEQTAAELGTARRLIDALGIEKVVSEEENGLWQL